MFEHINFEITQGKILSILGPNGAGKSTLLGCIAGLNPPSRGDILLNGKSIHRMQQREIACMVGFVPQNITPSFNYSVLDYVVTGCAPRMGVFQKPKAAEYEVAWQAICTMGLEHIARQSFMKISGGERQQVAVARVIAQKPAVILLDEPTSHLDFGNQMKVLVLLRRLADEGYGIVMTTHNPDHVLMLDDQVGVLARDGKFTFGMGREILKEDFLFKLYGTKLRIFDINALGRRVCVAQGIK